MSTNEVDENPWEWEYAARAGVGSLLKYLGEDAQREGLLETPNRYMAALQFMCQGYGQDPAEVMKAFTDGSEGYNELVFQANIPFYSLCEHHILPFFGNVHIGYVPQGKILGLSKLARVTDIFARRLQVQERLTGQIVDALMEGLDPAGAGVVIQARHMCMEARGVQKIGTATTTSALRGSFLDRPELRAEFLQLVTSSSRDVHP